MAMLSVSNDEIATKFQALYEREGKQIVARCATAQEMAEAFYRKGFEDANAVPSILSPEDAAKLESQTIGETINYAHLGDVIEAKKHVS